MARSPVGETWQAASGKGEAGGLEGHKMQGTHDCGVGV